jgi:NCAIR mutase (PurE)-related protein
MKTAIKQISETTKAFYMQMVDEIKQNLKQGVSEVIWPRCKNWSDYFKIVTAAYARENGYIIHGAIDSGTDYVDIFVTPATKILGEDNYSIITVPTEVNAEQVVKEITKYI